MADSKAAVIAAMRQLAAALPGPGRWHVTEAEYGLDLTYVWRPEPDAYGDEPWRRYGGDDLVALAAQAGLRPVKARALGEPDGLVHDWVRLA